MNCRASWARRCIAGLTAPQFSQTSTTRRLHSAMVRDYPEALRLLAQLASNRQVTHLFDKSAVSATTSTSASASASTFKPSPQDLNSKAIPEVLDWLRRAGYSPRDLTRLRHIHVSGTKGKGSVSAFTTGMLREYGSVGTYTSPHLVSVRERIALDGEPVSQEVFAQGFFELWDRFTEAARRGGVGAEEAEGAASKPFFFRFLTILAWHIFLKSGVESVVLEVGIGGEYDATNVVPAEAVSAAVITQLGIDHVAMLGNTIEEIAWHKAGILKRGVRGFVRRDDERPGVRAVLRSRAAEKGAELVEVADGVVEAWGGVGGRLAGEFQKYNQALAVLAVRRHLGMEEADAGLEASLREIPDKMVKGLREASIRGRCETIQDRDGGSVWLLDGAHTKDSLEQVAKWFVQSLDPKGSATLVFNQQERDVSGLLEGFLDAVRRAAAGREEHVFSHGVFTRNEHERPVGGEEVRDTEVQRQAALVMAERTPSCVVKVFDNSVDAVDEARRIARERGPGHKTVVTGSLHLVGGILRTLEPESLL